MRRKKYLFTALVFGMLTSAGLFVAARMSDDSFSPEFLAELNAVKPEQVYRIADVRHAPDLLPPVRLKADGKPIDIGQLTNFGHAGPCIADLDGDGDRDLLVGDFPGFFWRFDNVGSQTIGNVTILDNLTARLELIDESDSGISS